MRNDKDHYNVLGIDRDASASDVRKAFRRKARDCHPDCADKEHAPRFQKIAEAHEVLTDPDLRRSYDEELKRSDRRQRRRPTSAWSGASAPRWDGPIRDVAAARPAPRTAERLEVEVRLSPAEVLSGGRLPLFLEVNRRCGRCGGQGDLFFFSRGLFCHHCFGRGVVTEEVRLEVSLPPAVPDGEQLRVVIEPPTVSSPLELRLILRHASR